MKSIGIIGAGNLGSHLTKLLLRNNLNYFLTVSDVTPPSISKSCDVLITSNKENIKISDILVLTVKPNNIKSV